MKKSLIPSLAIIGLFAGGAWAGPITLDFDNDASGNPMPAGTVVTEQYAAWGVHITANNLSASHPDKAVVFDTANPTGGDTDLRTPGYHASNTVAMGNVLVLAENDVDANLDGLIDSPDDQANRPAGWINFVFDSLYSQAQLVMLDTEESGGTIDFLLGGAAVGSIAIPGIPDNAVQTLGFNGGSFNQIRVNFAGSGAIGSVTAVPEPASLALLAIGSLVGLRRRR